MNHLLPYALEYLGRRMSVIPIGERKKPTIRTWKPYQTALPSEDLVREWFSSTRPNGMAVICGSVSGNLCVRDFDVRESHERWARDHPVLAATLPTVQTARGRHVYFRNGLDCIVRQPDGELRGAGYCLLPPSVHPSGHIYEWVVPLPDGPLPEVDPYEVDLVACVTEQIEQTEHIDSIEEERSALNKTKDALPSEIERAIASTLPTGPGQRNHQVWELVRALKAISGLVNADDAQLRAIVKVWHRRARPFIRTKPFEEPWLDFVTAWRRCRLAEGGDLMLILEKAIATELPRVADDYEQDGVRVLVAFCRELQRASDDAPFYLSCRTASRLLGVDHNTAAR